jgi:hypothetical protein
MVFLYNTNQHELQRLAVSTLFLDTIVRILAIALISYSSLTSGEQDDIEETPTLRVTNMNV